MLGGRNGRGARVAEVGRHLNEGNTFTKKLGGWVGKGLGWCLLTLSQATFIQKPRRGKKVSSRTKTGRICCL